MLIRQTAQPDGEIGRCLLRVFEKGLFARSRQSRPPSEFERGLQLRDLCHAQTFDAVPGRKRRGHHRRQRAEAPDQFTSEFHRALALNSHAQQNRQQLRVSQRMRPVRQQPLARALIFWPLVDA